MSKKKITLLTLVILVAFSAVLMSGCSAKSEVTTDMNQEIKSAVSADEESGETENQVPVADAQAEEKSTEQNESNPALSGPDADGDGLPDDVEKTYGTNPYTPDSDGDGQNDLQDQQPTTTDVTISETSTVTLPVSFVDLRVENNATADHLEMTLKNTGNVTLDEFDIYYLITDKLNGSTESYYVKLDGLTILPGEKRQSILIMR